MSAGNDLSEWLLASATPSIRHAALARLLGLGSEEARVMEAHRQIMRSGPVPAILRGQTANGNWQPERGYYTPKYTSTHWSMLLLAELGADGEDPGLRRGAEYMLEATRRDIGKVVEARSHGLSCFWGNLLRYALHCGFSGDPRLAPIVEYLVRDALDWRWQCEHNWGHECAWGAARCLWALAHLPPRLRSGRVEHAVEAALGYLLVGDRLVRGDFPTGGRVHSIWSRLNFPLFYQADILFVLRAAAEVDALGRPGARAALDWLTARRRSNGRWRGASPFRRRTWQALSDAEEIDRWVSLHAALVLKSTPR